jgi:Uma2 family endonuclease
MDTSAEQREPGYTWSDYRTWWDDKRWEIIGGQAFDMTPVPLVRHQHIAGHLFSRLAAALVGKPCQPFISPVDVKLSEVDVVQPDLVVVCNLDQVKRTHIEGPPTIAVEILSPSSVGHDHVRKFQLYARSGVCEYWIVTPYPPLVEVYVLDGDHFRLAAGYEQHDLLRSPTVPDLAVVLSDVFDFPVDPEERVNVVREAHPPYASQASGRD